MYFTLLETTLIDQFVKHVASFLVKVVPFWIFFIFQNFLSPASEKIFIYLIIFDFILFFVLLRRSLSLRRSNRYDNIT